MPRGLNVNPLLKTLEIINDQTEELNIEVIIADDGSIYSKSIINDYSRKNNSNRDKRYHYVLEDEKLNYFLDLVNIKCKILSKWIYLPKIKSCMSKARVTNCAVLESQSNNLLLLDDDNYFISKNSIKNLIKLFETYDLVIGQIKDKNNRLRNFSSNRVQGTTIGIKKDIYNSIGGLGEWTENFSCGVDSDLWIKLYNYHFNNQKIQACFTNQISTYDSFSKRWKKYTKFFKEYKLKKEFYKRYQCKNYKSSKFNPSRNKINWIQNIDNE